MLYLHSLIEARLIDSLLEALGQGKQHTRVFRCIVEHLGREITTPVGLLLGLVQLVPELPVDYFFKAVHTFLPFLLVAHAASVFSVFFE